MDTETAMGIMITCISIILYFGIIFLWFVACIASAIGIWKMFKKAGQKPWISIIPGWNIWVICDLVFENNILWFVLCLIPPIQVVAANVACYRFVRAFGKSVFFSILSLIIPFVIFPIVGLGKSEYVGIDNVN